MSIPTFISEALAHLGWRQAMLYELSILHSNGTSEFVPYGSVESIVACRWGFAIKFGFDGTIDRLKARLVALVYINF